MNTKTTNQTLILIVSTLLCGAASERARSQTSTAFTYSGHLSQAGQPANQPHDLTFRLFTTALGGSPVAAVTNANVAVSKGVFITSVDFGPGFFDGTDYWLELGVRPGGTSVDFNILDPRQPITRTPYALWASQAAEATSAQTAAAVAAGAIGRDGLADGAVTTDKIFDGTIAFSDLSASAQNAFWRLDGNAGTTAGLNFLGTTDNQALELKVNNRRAFRLEYATDNFGNAFPNLIGGSFNTISTCGSLIGGGAYNVIGADSYYGTVAGGYANHIGTNSFASAIGGGQNNAIGTNAWQSTISGGLNHAIGTLSYVSTIGGGSLNQIADNSYASTIAGGSTHDIGSSSPNSTIGGGRINVIGDQSDSSTIAGGYSNSVGPSSSYTSIGGGQRNTIEGSAASATISGGEGNSIRPDASQATISGGSGNVVSDRSRHSAISGGNLNWIQHDAAFGTIGGGHSNRIRTNAWQATIGGGDNNHVGGEASGGTISGGMANRVLDHATMATIPGGYANQATNLAFAAGYQAQAVHSGAFVWSDGEGTPTASTNANSVTLRGRGGYRLLTSGGDTGAFLAAGSGSWSSMSDRASKENFEPVNADEILAKVVALPLSSWNYKTQHSTTRHLGPIAQDFHATFGVGENDTSITTVDADGVALAAIQGLNQKVEEQKAENAELKKRLAALEQLLSKLNLPRD